MTTLETAKYLYYLTGHPDHLKYIRYCRVAQKTTITGKIKKTLQALRILFKLIIRSLLKVKL